MGTVKQDVLQVRKDLQISTASNDRLSRDIGDLQRDTEDLDSGQRSIQLQINQIIQSLRNLKEPGSRGQDEPHSRSVKVSRKR